MLRAGRGGCMVEGMTFSLEQPARAIPVAAVLLPGDALAEGNAACPGGDATGGPYYDPCADIDGNCDGNYSVDFEPGQCAPVSGIGFMQLTITGTPAAGAAKEQQVLYVLSGDGLIKEFGFAPMFGASQLTAPRCVAIDAIDLGTGEVVVGAPECFGEDVKAQLGPQALDPEASLDCAPQVCAVDQGGFQWDLEMCAPYSGGGETPTEGGGSGTDEASGEGGGDAGGQDGEKGCGCDVRGGGTPWLVVLGLGWLGRRRRCGG